MKRIVLWPSELSGVTGYSKFCNLDEILKRNDLSKVYIPKSSVEESLLSRSHVELTELKKELKLPESANIIDIEKHIKENIINKSLDKEITEDKSKTNINNELINKPILSKICESAIKKDLRMKRGNVKENHNLNKTEKQFNMKISHRNSQKYCKSLYTSPDSIYEIVLRGKVDGKTDDIIIETKNRSYKLFKTIPIYEKVQLEAYMFLTGLEKTIHIECYNDEQIKTEYNHDEDFWNICFKNIVNYVDVNIRPHIVNSTILEVEPEPEAEFK